MTFTMNAHPTRFEKKSAYLIMALLDHEGEGSLYQCLKSLNYVQDICTDDNACIATPFKMWTLEFALTEVGIENYQKILALVFEYIRMVKDEWLAKNKILDVWKE